MGAVDGLPVPAGLGRVLLLLPGRAARSKVASRCGGDTQLRGSVRELRYRLVAEVVVVGVVLCMSWTHDSRIPSGFAVPGNRPIATAAPGGSPGPGAGKARCRPPLPFRQVPDSRGQQRGRVVLDVYIQSGAAPDSPEVGVPGERGVLAASGIACGPARSWFLVSHPAMPWLPRSHGRDGLRMLVSGRWPAEDPAQRRPGGCMTSRAPGQAQRRLGAAVSGIPPPAGAGRVSRSGTSSRINLAAYRLRAALSPPPSLICVMTSPQGRRAGPRLPERWCSALGGSGGQTGAGDRASLPCRSTRYRVIWFVCLECGARMECLFYDEGDMPLCQNPSHGQMEVRR
jgi:hypothetical protein